MGIKSTPTSRVSCEDKTRSAPGVQKVLLVVANGVSTFFEEIDRLIIKPGSPQFCYLMVDIVTVHWELVFRVKVVISHSSIDFSIWEEGKTYD